MREKLTSMNMIQSSKCETTQISIKTKLHSKLTGYALNKENNYKQVQFGTLNVYKVGEM